MCEVPFAVDFYSELRARLGLVIPPVPHHITVYTGSAPESLRGIGLPNFHDLEKHSMVIGSEAAQQLPKELFVGD
jgi:hypothetical protein